jgi:hypothetical protein
MNDLHEEVNPSVRNFIKSIRDFGYTFEVAVADIIDNSISAGASKINIYCVGDVFALLDNGVGMDEEELKECMRLASKDPSKPREKNDLGRFGLGLKTASWSQCKNLTVISRKDGITSSRSWDLDYIEKHDKWLLLKPKTNLNEPLHEELNKLETGTLVIWKNFDRNPKITDNLEKLRQHLSLVFHRFLEGAGRFGKLQISINKNPLIPFNPFNEDHPATQEIQIEKIKINGVTIAVTPYILPHHSKLSSQEYDRYATEEGYIKSQGFYLYRENRILIYGTWWGLHRASDAHKLVRIRIDIPNSLDTLWGIDVKKSTARPNKEIKGELKKIISQITVKGSKPYTGRGNKIKDLTVDRFWQLKQLNDSKIRFCINRAHPLINRIRKDLMEDNKSMFDTFLNSLEAYMPLEAIQANLQSRPKEIIQESALNEIEIIELAEKLKELGMSKEDFENWAKTELFNKDGLKTIYND